MSEHPRNFPVEQQIPASMVVPALGGPIEIEARGGPASRRQLVTTAPAAAAEILPPTPQAKPHRLRKLLLVGASVLALAGSAHFGWNYWTTGRFNVSTDDAYVKADNITIAPKVAGYIGGVLVGDNEQVKAGQVLAWIDDRDFRVSVDQARADVETARAAIASKEAQLTAQQSVIQAARATIDVDQANLTFAEQDDQRYAHLSSTGYGSVQNAQQSASRLAAARASVVRDTASLENATRQLDILKAELGQAQAAFAQRQALLRQAELNLSYTSIVAPADGVVGNRTLRVGQYVQAGTQLMAVVPTASAYIIANYKETQLTNVRAGQPATVAIDTYPGVTFRGRVDSIAPASGQEFALLPPDNATGNFTKVVQRIPVKIVLDRGTSLAADLRPGMSVIPTIDTKQQDVRTASAANRRG